MNDLLLKGELTPTDLRDLWAADTSRLAVMGLVGAVLGAVLLAVVARKPVRGLYLYFFCSGILVTPSLPVVREKVSIAEPMLLSALVGMAATFLYRRARRVPGATPLLGLQRWVLASAAGFVAAAGASLVYNHLGGRQELTKGVVEVATYLLGLAALAATVVEIDSYRKWVRAVLAWSAGAGVVTAVGLMAMFVYAPSFTRDEFTGRISSTLKFENQVASYVGPVLPVAAVLVERYFRSRWLLRAAALGVLGTIVVLIGTGSRTAFLISLIALCGVVLVLFQDGLRRRKPSVLAPTIAAAGVAGLVAVVVAVAADDGTPYKLGVTPAWQRPVKMTLEAARGKRTLVNETRTDYTTRPLKELPGSPLFGYGPANFGFRFAQSEVHNSFLTVVGEEGLLGLACFGALVVLTGRCGLFAWRVLRRHPNQAIVTGFLFGFAILMLYQLTVNGLRQRPLWFGIGLVACLPRVALELETRRREARRAARLAAAGFPSGPGPGPAPVPAAARRPPVRRRARRLAR